MDGVGQLALLAAACVAAVHVVDWACFLCYCLGKPSRACQDSNCQAADSQPRPGGRSTIPYVSPIWSIRLLWGTREGDDACRHDLEVLQALSA